MANMLQSSQNVAQTTPSWYTNYLQNISSQGQAAQQAAQYVCASPLQQQAFKNICQNQGTYTPTVTQGTSLLNKAGAQCISGASSPYIAAGTSSSPLSAAQPLINQGASMNLGCVAKCYMSPYLQSAVQCMSDVAMRNIQQNLSPQATAAAVGSGQFGSQRGAQVLGQVEANAMKCLNSQIAAMENTGYQSALSAAQAKQNAIDTLAGTTATAQQAQNTANLQGAQLAQCAAAKQAAALTSAGSGLGTLATQGQNINLSCANALATLGCQQRTIAQNKQLFPLTTLASLSNLMSGANIPTTTTTTLCMSPLSGAAAVASLGRGILKCTGVGASICQGITGLIKGLGSSTCTGGQCTVPKCFYNSQCWNDYLKKTYGCTTMPTCTCLGCLGIMNGCASGGSVDAKSRGYGCSSTQYRGALPSKG